MDHFMITAFHNICMTLLVSRLLFAGDGLMQAHLTSMAFLMSGCTTLVQATIGSRLPVYQGGQLAVVLPLAALSQAVKYASTDGNMHTTNATIQECSPVVSEVRTSIVISAIVQQLLGLTGLMSMLLPWITPLVIAPTVALIGFSLYEMVAIMAATHWPIALSTACLSVILILYIGELSIPCWSNQNSSMEHININLTPHFRVFVVLLLMWGLCSVLTSVGVLEDLTMTRADNTTTFLHEAPWFTIPKLALCWSSPSAAGVAAMLIAVLASTIEGFTNYYDAARILSITYPPAHTVNRGMGVEGLGTMLS
ncbi:unnamed protein product, partial [Meganyctiphanes norvegica]